jgi:hypothetical protein
MWTDAMSGFWNFISTSKSIGNIHGYILYVWFDRL